MTKRKALVIYGSITGNTKMIASAFAEVCEEYGFETDLVKIDPRRDWEKEPVFTEDYDLICLGSPIIAGLPYREVSMLMGLQGRKQLYRNREVYNKLMDMKAKGIPFAPGAFEDPTVDPDAYPHPMAHRLTGIPGLVTPATGTGYPGAKGERKKTIYGVAFCTYGGSGVGPEECYGTLDVLVEFLRVNGARTVGKYACPGKELRHESVDKLAGKLKMNIDDSQALMQRYKDNPESEEFKTMDPEKVKVLADAASVKDEDSFGEGNAMMVNNDPLGCGKPGSVFWHYDFQNRPSARDITKAKIFMAEVIEDHFLTMTGDPRPPYSMYTSIC